MDLLFRMLWLTYAPQWMHSQIPDETHFYRRQFTPAYRKKMILVRRLWVFSGLLVLCFPTFIFLAVISLFSTFLSFCLLDET